MSKGYETTLPASSRFVLTMPHEDTFRASNFIFPKKAQTNTQRNCSGNLDSAGNQAGDFLGGCFAHRLVSHFGPAP
jgi:hypothetical protein